MSAGRLSYVVLLGADVERSRQFYESVGLQLIAEQHGAGLSLEQDRGRGSTLDCDR